MKPLLFTIRPYHQVNALK